MKHLAVTLLFVVVYLSFAPRVSAQCIDYASCIGEKAEIDARLRPWARETAEAKAEERRATAQARVEERRATAEAKQATAQAAIPTATDTPRPMPSVTPQPQATNTQLSTQEPSATPNLGATVVSVAVSALQRPQAIPKPVNATAAEMERRQTISAILIIAIIAVLGGGVWFLIRVLTAKHTIEI